MKERNEWLFHGQPMVSLSHLHIKSEDEFHAAATTTIYGEKKQKINCYAKKTSASPRFSYQVPLGLFSVTIFRIVNSQEWNVRNVNSRFNSFSRQSTFLGIR